MTTFPAAIIAGGALVAVHRYAVAFIGPDGVKHPAQAWTSWTAEDWAEKCPGWSVVPLVDPAPADTDTHRYVRNDEAQWTVSADAVTVTYTAVSISLSERRTNAVAAINAERNRRLTLGAPYGGKLIDVSDKGRADLGGMVSAAMLATSNTIPWGTGYSDGWITQDNTRVALPTPADGIALAASVGDWYGRTMQYARDLKDAALVSAEPEALLASAVWP